MEALDFLKEAQRMCRSEECFLNCPVHDVCFLDNYDVVSEEDMRIFVSSVVAWSKKHPPKTNAQKFKEVFGEKTIDQLALCETRTVGPNVPKLFTKPSSWWDKPYKEPEDNDNA